MAETEDHQDLTDKLLETIRQFESSKPVTAKDLAELYGTLAVIYDLVVATHKLASGVSNIEYRREQEEMFAKRRGQLLERIATGLGAKWETDV